jgi:O-antigen/teichoic acid export membrane protein
MALVATLRTRWFVAITLLGAACFVAGTRALVPQLGLQAAPWAYLATGALQTLLAVWALRDLLWLTPSGVVAPAALSTSAGPTLGAAAVSAEGPTVSPPSLPAAPGGVAR